MSRRTLKQLDSSRSSGKAFTLKPERSVALALWWVSIHCLAVASVLLSSLSVPLELAGVALTLAHALARRPARPTTLLRHEDGSWSVPERGMTGLALGEGTSLGPFWIALHLGAGRRRASLLLLRDQLDPETWRALQAELRRLRADASI